jgi:L-asparaginase II
MTNPVLVEALRGSRVESRHRGAVAIADADGTIVLELGDVEPPIYPRSAIKALQALPLIETGAAVRYGFADAELALACASHGGEPSHVAVVERMLGRIDLDTSALECGAHLPIHQGAAHALVRAGRSPSAVHNNCSGKHAGFLACCRAMEVDHRGYVSPAHPVQREVKAAIESLAGLSIPDDRCAVDGCSVPTWALPLRNLARAFARFGTGKGLAAGRAAAAARLRAACAANPFLIAGTGRFCTQVMEALGSRVFVKSGAEGMQCAAVPELGLGIALKCDDGAARAAEVMMALAISRLMRDDAAKAALAPFMRPELHNWKGTVVGRLRPTAAS